MVVWVGGSSVGDGDGVQAGRQAGRQADRQTRLLTESRTEPRAFSSLSRLSFCRIRSWIEVVAEEVALLPEATDGE